MVCQQVVRSGGVVESLRSFGCPGRSIPLGVRFVSLLGDPWGRVEVCMAPLVTCICTWLFPTCLHRSCPLGGLGGGRHIGLWGSVDSQCRCLVPRLWGLRVLGRICNVCQLCVTGIAWPFRDIWGTFNPMLHVPILGSWHSGIGLGRWPRSSLSYGCLHRCCRCHQIFCNLWQSGILRMTGISCSGLVREGVCRQGSVPQGWLGRL